MPEEGWRPWSTTPETWVQLPPTRHPHLRIRRSIARYQHFPLPAGRHFVARHAVNTHMTNRIQHLFDERAESLPSGEYFVVAGEFGQVFVTRETASQLRNIVSRIFAPRWVEFRMMVGSLMFVRTKQVQMIVESTIEQRAAAREFWREREAEDSSDRRPWDPD